MSLSTVLGRPRAGAVRAATRPAASGASASWRWALLGGLVGLATTLAVFAPARWAAWAVEQASDGRLRLDAPRGTVWNGSAGLVVTGGAGSRDTATLPSRVRWQLRPALPATLRLSLSADCSGLTLPVPRLPRPSVPQWARPMFKPPISGSAPWPVMPATARLPIPKRRAC